MMQLLIYLMFALALSGVGYVATMSKEEKELREEIDSLHQEMKGITKEAKEEERSLTKEEREKHEELYNQIQEKKDQIQALQRERELESELNEEAEPVGSEEGEEEKVTVNGHRAESEDAMYHHTAKMFGAMVSPDKEPQERAEEIKDAQVKMYKGGHYGGFKASVEAFSTLTDKDGGIFLPTTISDEIMEITREYGAFPANSMQIPMEVGGGRQIVPNLTGEITFHAVNQGNEAKASRFTFEGIALEELKWMGYVPWTYEVGEAQGERLVNLIMRKIAEGAARVKDDAAINGDAKSGYNGLYGILQRSSDSDHPEVRRSTAATGNSSFSDIDEQDFNNARLDVAPSIRSRGIYVMHNDWDVRLSGITDDNGRPLYLTGGAIQRIDGQWFIWGHPVVFTEKAPNTDGANNAYAIFYVPEFFAFGDVEAFTTQSLTEATIKDENDNDIRLASQDMQALRMKTFFDYELSQLVVSSGGNDLGAFTVLETAS